MRWYLSCLSNYANFSGRARRKEYWMFVLFSTIFSVVLRWIDAIIIIASGMSLEIGILSSIYFLVLFVPTMAVQVRRLHDTDRSGWCWLLNLIPIVGSLVLFIWFVEEGTDGNNEYGSDPKVYV